MKHCIVFCVCCIGLFNQALQAQQNHFIYLQTENKQPFYVKLDNNILSSSVSGYLILPKLKDGRYNFSLGFPKKEWSEQKFSCTVASADAGYLVKNFGDKGWGLFNLQTLDVTMSGVPNQQQGGKTEDKTDEFSTLLSNAVNDPSILKKDVVAPAPVIKDTVKAVSTEDKIQQIPPQPVAASAEKIKEATVPEPVFKVQDEIKKIQESTTAKETTLTYIVKTNGITDTVSISIPEQAEAKNLSPDTATVKEKEAVAAAPQKAIVDEPKAIIKAADTLKVEQQPVKEKFLQIDMPATLTKADSTTPVKSKVTEKIIEIKDSVATDEKSAASIVNSDCISNASDDDFLKIRKKMASASSDEDMMGIAKKAFKQKCFSTDQVKNLGVLFLKDESRYNFFDLAYPHVWDSSNFKQLEGQLADPYYANRFKAMIRH